ncbi:MAG TPA: sulfite exporter TauE/SafE family protein, partial [Methylomirabilota bacterium]
LSMELAVAFMLVLLGVLSLTATLRPAPERPEPHDLDRALGELSIYRLLRPFAVGVVHGLAGSAAVALLVLTTIRDPLWAALYLLVFGAGTIAGMMLITGLMAWPFAHLGQRSATIRRRLTTITGVLSLAFGVFLAYQIGIVDGLLTGH